MDGVLVFGNDDGLSAFHGDNICLVSLDLFAVEWALADNHGDLGLFLGFHGTLNMYYIENRVIKL